MARVLAAFHDSLGGERYLTFNPGVIAGGTTVDFDAAQGRGTAAGKLNVIAQDAVAAGDLRALTPEQRDHAKDVMRRLVAASYPHTSAEITFDDAYPPLAPTEGNKALLALLDGASRDLGLGPVEAVDPAKAGAADISFTAGHVNRALDGLGLMGTGGHTVDETADLRTLASQAKKVAVLLLRLPEAIGNGRP
jgi:glutamate carboxypeptidase